MPNLPLKSETPPAYAITRDEQLAEEDQIIRSALKILNRRMARSNGIIPLTCPQLVRDFLFLKLAGLEHEVFVAIWLDSQNRFLALEELFRGSLTQTDVHPREVIKAALARNAGAVIFAHNHPSGLAEPSRADEQLTTELKQVLALIEVRVLDHFIVGENVVSLAERGLL